MKDIIKLLKKDTINNVKNYLIKLREQLDEIEKDLDSDDDYKNMKACYYGVALSICCKDIPNKIDELIASSEKLKLNLKDK
jgi:hypothetical protein